MEGKLSSGHEARSLFGKQFYEGYIRFDVVIDTSPPRFIPAALPGEGQNSDQV